MPIRDDENDGAEEGGEEAAPEAPKSGLRNWMTGRRGWLIIIALAVAQGLFAMIVLYFRADVRPTRQGPPARIQELMADMLGHEVAINNISLYLPLRGGRKFSLGMEMVLVLGQLPAERVEGTPRPNESEFALFVAAIQSMEPRIRSRLTTLLQGLPPESYDGPEALKKIKDDVLQLVNDNLEELDFGKGLRPGVGKRRVTEVLVPLFLRQLA